MSWLALLLLAGPPADSAFLEHCQITCRRQNMARAVHADVIDRDCRTSCEKDEKLPKIETKSEFTKAEGTRVLLRGKLGVETKVGNKLKLFLTLGDGARIELVAG